MSRTILQISINAACMQDVGYHVAHQATAAAGWGFDWHLLLRLMKREHRPRGSCDRRAVTLFACHHGCSPDHIQVRQTPRRAGWVGGDGKHLIHNAYPPKPNAALPCCPTSWAAFAAAAPGALRCIYAIGRSYVSRYTGLECD